MTQVQHHSFFTMGTRCNIVLPGMDADESEVIARHLKTEILRIEGLLSRFLPDSEVSKVNEEASQQPVAVKDELFQVLKSCRHYHELTGGYFDITLRPVMQYWQDLPTGDTDTIDKLLMGLGTDKISLHDDGGYVSFQNENLSIDLGGFGKGYALDQVNRMLLRFGVENAFISMGESSILTLGNHPAGDCWKVGIKDYKAPDHSLHTFHVRYGSVSTSSNFFVDDNGDLVNNRHVIQPKTGIPVDDMVTVSVCAESAELAEVMSTALLVMPDELIEQASHKLPNMEVLKVDYGTGEANLTFFSNIEIFNS